MQLRPRTRRRLAAAAAVIYFAVILWALSPLVRPVAHERDVPTPVRDVSGSSSVGAMSIARADGMPMRPPGSASVEPVTPSGEATSEPIASETEYSEPVTESAPPSGVGGSGQSSTGGSREGSGETVIGFEG